MITTAGFRDTLEIGRLRYPRLYDLGWRKPKPLVPRRWRIEVRERIDPRGAVVEPLDEQSARDAIRFLVDEGVQTVAVCLLHAYANPAHELRVREVIAAIAPVLPIALSSEVLPEIGEYERTSTTVIDAYLRPVVGRYLAQLANGVRSVGVDAPVMVMQSNGGVMPAGDAAEHPMHIVESGPAAGVIAAQELARRLGVADAITLDMGGTTAKSSVIEAGQLLRATEYEVGAGLNVGNRLNRGAGYILRVPAIDVAEVGAGGGSLVWVDDAGALHVGPRSAGASPGPVCYGQGGEEPTLTDANLILGYLNQQSLLGGALPIDRGRAECALRERIADRLGLDLLATADGVRRLGVASMVRAVKAVTSERGRDPRGFGLVAFGGNGPLHAAAVAEELGLSRVIVPPLPGLFSAIGLLVAEPTRHYSRTILRDVARLPPDELERAFRLLEQRAPDGMAISRWADLRYAGQSFELRVAADQLDRLRDLFEQEHERTYGHRNTGDPVELVHLRVVATGEGAQVRASEPLPSDGVLETTTPSPWPSPTGRGDSIRAAFFGGAMVETAVLRRGDVTSAGLAGPAIVEEYDATTLVPPEWTVKRDEMNNLVLTPR